MRTTVQLLDLVKKRLGGISDYKAAAALDVKTATVSLWRTGKSAMGEANALRVAKTLGIDAGYVLACVQAERAKSDQVRAAWKRVAKHFKPPAKALLL